MLPSLGKAMIGEESVLPTAGDEDPPDLDANPPGEEPRAPESTALSTANRLLEIKRKGRNSDQR